MHKIALTAIAALGILAVASIPSAIGQSYDDGLGCIDARTCEVAMVTVTPMAGSKMKPMVMPVIVPTGFVNMAPPATMATETDQSCLKARTCPYLMMMSPQ